MTHLELENLVSDYLEGLLAPALKAEVEAHLRTCPSCLEVVEDVRQVMQLCHSATELEPAPGWFRRSCWPLWASADPPWQTASWPSSGLPFNPDSLMVLRWLCFRFPSSLVRRASI